MMEYSLYHDMTNCVIYLEYCGISWLLNMTRTTPFLYHDQVYIGYIVPDIAPDIAPDVFYIGIYGDRARYRRSRYRELHDIVFHAIV